MNDFRNGYFDSRSYKALDEFILSEKKFRLNWLQRYERLNRKYPNKNVYTWGSMFEFTKNEEDEEKRGKLPELKFPPQLKLKNDESSKFDDYFKRIGLKDKHLNITRGDSYEIGEKHKNMLHSSSNFCNRKAYLKERGMLAPEKRYKVPLCSSMDYGWRNSDELHKAETLIGSEHGVRNVIANTFYRSNGVFNAD